MRNQAIAIIIGMILLFAGGYLYLNNQNSSEDYLPKEQRKNVEAYFVENMRVSPAEATEMASKGVDLRVVQEFLGHRNIATTQVYTHVTRPHLREIHRKLHGSKI